MGLGTFHIRKKRLEHSIKKNKSILGNLKKRTYKGFAQSENILFNINIMEKALEQLEKDIIKKKNLKMPIKSWSKYLDVFKNADKIAEGIKNNIFKKEHVEAIAQERFKICIACSLFDARGDNCMAPGTQPCCSDCGCSLAFKVRSLSSDCPKHIGMQ